MSLPAPLRVCGILACHNRKDKTLACLHAFFALARPPHVALQAVILDDASSDGTAEAVRHAFPQVKLLSGNGHSFWCGGMRQAWQEAARANPDYYLLLNDDTLLRTDALEKLFALIPDPNTPGLAVGAIADPATGRWSYGGVPTRVGATLTSSEPRPVRSFNGNCVLIPRSVFQKLGMFHSAYTHALGDYDYGFAATRAGFFIRETPEFVGTCPRDHRDPAWQDHTLNRWTRLRLLNSPKGLPYREWWTYCRRNHGWLWPFRWISPTLRILLGR